MKKIILSFLIGGSMFATTVFVNAQDIKNKNDVFVKVNGKEKSEKDLANAIDFNAGYTPALDALELKVLSEKYKGDSRLQKLIDDKYKAKLEEVKKTDPNLKLDYKLFAATSKEDYIKKSGILLEAYRDLARMQAAYDNLFTQYQKDYIYKYRFSGTAKLYTILVEPEISLSDKSSKDKIDKAMAKALQDAEAIVTKLNNKEDFKKLANEVSANKNVLENGYLGEFDVNTAREAKIDQAIINEAFQLEDKKFSQPIKTQFGYQIVYVEYTKEKKTYDKVQNDVMSILYDLFTTNNSYTKDYALNIFRSDNKLELFDNIQSKNFANSYLQSKKSYIQYDPTKQNYGY